MLAVFNVYELKKDIEKKSEQYPSLFEKTKTVTGLHAFMQSLDGGFDMPLHSFRAYFAAVGGLVVKYGEHYDSFEELIEYCEITSLKVARIKAKSAMQVAFEKLAEENKKMLQEQQQEILKREMCELMAEREQEAAGERPKRAKILSLPAQAAAAEAAEAEAEEEVNEEQALVLTNILSRRESVSSTSSLDLKMRNLEVRAAFDKATNDEKDDTIKLLKRKIRILREQVAQMKIQLGEKAIAIADHVDETFLGDTQGDSQWD